ncbi:hypothetical protein [Streptomyces sp. NPDC057545]|uniref:hypothetical protein n=1 Tax=Streptomyces sp. NPDC057545 TaxID=3346164 RepID=UPI00367FCCD0
MARFKITPESTKVIPAGHYQWSGWVTPDGNLRNLVPVAGGADQPEPLTVAAFAASLSANVRKQLGPRARLADIELWN